MPPNQGFTDSDIASFRHETDRSLGEKRTGRLKHDDGPRIKRSDPNPRDARLSPVATVWLVRLSDELRPLALCDRYPRIANRLAICWEDPQLTALVFRELLEDRRGNRRGFPPDVKRELITLRDHMRRWTLT